MVLGTDLGSGNVDISLVLKVFLKRCVFSCFSSFFNLICFWLIEKKHQKNVVILGGQNVDIMLVLIGFSEMRVFSQVSFFNDGFENVKGKKRTWANPMSSKQWKSLYEIDNFTFLFVYVFFRFLKKYEK